MLLGENKETDWKIINYRTVGDMVTAEYLHDLYNQAVIELNPTRFRNTTCVIESGMFKSFAPQKEWDYLAEVLGNDLIRNKDLRQNFSKYLERSQEDLHNLMSDLRGKYGQEKQVKRTDAFYDLKQLHFLALDRIYAINLVQFEHALGYALEKLAVEEGVDVDKILKSDELTISGQEESGSLELSIRVSKGEISLEDAIAEHREKFGDVNLAYGAKGEGLKDTSVSRMEEFLAKDLEARVSRLNFIRSAVKTSDEVIGSKKLNEIADLAKKLGERRDRNKALMGKVAGVRTSIMDEIANTAKIDRDELNSYFLQDIYELLINDKKLDADEIEKRKGRIVLQRQEQELYAAEAISLSEKVMPKIGLDNTLHGITASAGKVKGKVRHVYNIEDAEKISEDEILVAYGTDFDLMVGLQKCAGVITEEGGILSHASVISRELGKPCLINVKNAMHTLSDGDYIELDTDSKKVTLLKRSSIDLERKDEWGFVDEVELDEISGEKAKNIHVLMNSGLPVLPAVTLTIEDKDADVQKYAGDILKAFSGRGVKPNSFIVRSNTQNEDVDGNSMAGQFDSIECQGKDNLMADTIRKVLASYEEAKTYGADYNAEGFDNNTVLIQPYYPQSLGGVAFSHNPVTGKKKVVIEASTDGARAVVEGDNIAQDIPEELQNEISKAVDHIEEIYNQPVDVEWGYGADGLKIFQARPIVFKNVEADRTVVLIAGGKGTRIKEMFNERSAPFTKHFLPLPTKGGSLIGSAIEKSREFFSEIEISVGPENEMFMRSNYEGQPGITIADDPDMIGPLAPVFRRLLNRGKRVYGYTGDAYSDFCWDEMSEFHDRHENPVTLLASRSFPADKAACFSVEQDGLVGSWIRKDRSTEDDYINIGGYIIDPAPEVIEIAEDLIAKGKCKEDLFFAACIEKGILSAYKEEGFSCNINTPDVYNRLVDKLLEDKKQKNINLITSTMVNPLV